MTNRQNLLKENLYDLLCRMNDNITQCNVHDETPCIMAGSESQTGTIYARNIIRTAMPAFLNISHLKEGDHNGKNYRLARQDVQTSEGRNVHA